MEDRLEDVNSCHHLHVSAAFDDDDGLLTRLAILS